MQIAFAGPGRQRQGRIGAQRLRQLVGPVAVDRRTRRQGGQQLASGLVAIALGQAGDRVGIGDTAGHWCSVAVVDGQHQHVGAPRVEAVEVALPGLVQQDVARLHAMTAGVAGLHIAAAQHQGREAVVVRVPRQRLTRRVTQPPRLGAPDRRRM